MRALPAGRGARTAAGAVVLLALVLVAVLVGLVGADGSGATSPGGGATAGVSATASRAGRASATPVRPRAASRDAETGLPLVALRELPREAQQTVALVDAGGPFPYAKDGVTFGNYARVLPAHPRGWYHEYTVRTPGSHDRGPRRVVTGDDRQVFYTADHYATFVQVAR